MRESGRCRERKIDGWRWRERGESEREINIEREVWREGERKGGR